MTALEVDKPQCFADFYGDDIPSHHRVLIIRGVQQKWIWLTPHGDAQTGDLSVLRVIPLRRGAALLSRCFTEGACSFGPLSPDDLAYYTADAGILAKLLGHPVASDSGADTAGAQWFICCPGSAKYGSAVPESAFATDEIFVSRGSRALVELDGVWVSAARVGPPATWDSTVRAWVDGKARDPRILGDVRGVNGARHPGFRDVFEHSREASLPGFPLKDPWPAPELLASIRGLGQSSFDEHSMVWTGKSGVPEKSSAAMEHRVLSITLRMLVSYDQIASANCAAAKSLTRRLVQVEAATRRNPRQPGFESLDGFADSALDELGVAALPRFPEWIGKQRQNEAADLKAGPQWRK